jgi:4'-phosphopantetheinyl transferase EntD
MGAARNHAISELFPDSVITVTATPAMFEAELHPDEQAHLARVGARLRRREFTAGRACARAALAQLGIFDFPLLVGPDRAPIWPATVVGSISHCGDYCAVAVAPKSAIAGLGLDVEESGPLALELVELVCTARERDLLRSGDGTEDLELAKLLFSAKEATYKCYAPLGRTVLDFQDVEIELDPGAGSFTARLVNPAVPPARLARCFEGRYRVAARRVLSGVTLAAT